MKIKLEKFAYNKGYYVCKNGLMYNPRGKRIANHHSGTGYYGATFRFKTKFKKCKVHRLQAYQKYGDLIYEKEIVVRHLDGNSFNNSWENIKIGTYQQNSLDISKEKRFERALNATSYIRKYDKKEVRMFYASVKSYKETMEKFNISSKGTLHYVLNSAIVF